MKVVGMVARILLGLIFVVFGFNHIVPFIPQQAPPPGAAGQFLSAMISSRFFIIVGMLEVMPGLLLLANRYVPLALTLLGPIIVNILLVSLLMEPMGLPSGAVVAILWLLLYRRNRAAFAGIFQKQVEG
jgi:hypothetical protein